MRARLAAVVASFVVFAAAPLFARPSEDAASGFSRSAQPRSVLASMAHDDASGIAQNSDGATSIQLAPDVQVLLPGTEATLTATVLDEGTSAVSGAMVLFEISRGLQFVDAVSRVTDVNGQAGLTYQGPDFEVDDRIVACTNPDLTLPETCSDPGVVLSFDAFVRWLHVEPERVSCRASVVRVGSPLLMTATNRFEVGSRDECRDEDFTLVSLPRGTGPPGPISLRALHAQTIAPRAARAEVASLIIRDALGEPVVVAANLYSSALAECAGELMMEASSGLVTLEVRGRQIDVGGGSPQHIGIPGVGDLYLNQIRIEVDGQLLDEDDVLEGASEAHLTATSLAFHDATGLIGDLIVAQSHVSVVCPTFICFPDCGPRGYNFLRRFFEP